MLSISIAMATYNGETYIREQLASLASQTLLPSELVVTDDGSSDRTVALLEEFAATAPFPVRIEMNSYRLGYRGNFMKAAGLCSSALISFCDQDDIWHPAKLETVARLFTSGEITLVTHNAAVIDVTDERIGTLFDDPTSNSRDLFVQGPWPLQLGFTQTFRKHLMDYAFLWRHAVSHFADVEIGHDRWISFLSAALGKTVILKDELVSYRHHSANVFGGTPKSSPESLQQQTKAVRSRLHVLDLLPPTGKNVQTLKDQYRLLLLLLRMRRRAHSNASIGSRLANLIQLHRHSAYNRGAWGFSCRDALGDLCAGFSFRKSI